MKELEMTGLIVRGNTELRWYRVFCVTFVLNVGEKRLVLDSSCTISALRN